jgi:hypothetical protein
MITEKNLPRKPRFSVWLRIGLAVVACLVWWLASRPAHAEFKLQRNIGTSGQNSRLYSRRSGVGIYQ